VGLAADETIASLNPAAERLYGYLAAEVMGQAGASLWPPDRRSEHEETCRRALAGETVGQIETEALRKDGGKLPVAVTASPIRDSDEGVIGIAQIVRDVTERTRFERELKFYAEHDPLTGLFNRRRFTEELSRYVAYQERYPYFGGALLMGDLDNFKYVNDTLGHKAGDELIKAVGHLIHDRLRDTDVVGRLGGDEFAVLLPRADLAQATAVAETVRDAVQWFETVIEGRRLHTTISIGVTLLDADVIAQDALAAADAAMYAAKHGGRDRVAIASAGEQDQGLRQHIGWAERLRKALDQDRFELHSQPIVRLSTGDVTRYELLLRMREQGELVPPTAFIYAAERFGLIEQIDHRVISRAVAMLAQDLRSENHYHVNLSGISIARPELLDFLAGQLTVAGVDPRRLTLEVTETAAIIDMDVARRFAVGLRDIGCGLALDGFGSGFGSFSYLKYVPVQFLKIDGDFVAGCAESPHDRLLMKAIIDVARGMQIQTIAERVNSETVLRVLTDYGADYGQGYHLGRPLPVPPSH
jgi:diguanylate cyclase (GGDEF)-like protein/PAS domain S-box-containing protein